MTTDPPQGKRKSSSKPQGPKKVNRSLLLVVAQFPDSDI